MRSIVRPSARLGVGDAVRFIGTDKPFVVKEYDPKTLEY
jgi:hypothetical protein